MKKLITIIFTVIVLATSPSPQDLLLYLLDLIFPLVR
jgi:hypothetical protein